MTTALKRILQAMLGILFIAAAYLGFSVYLDSIFIRTQSSDHSQYFRAGDRLFSRFEGFDQTVLGEKDGWVHLRLEVLPNAAGPPEHAHAHFTETFTVRKGQLSVVINGEKRIVREGETVSIAPMTMHRPFNETSETVIVESEDEKTLPVEFAYHLSQMYGFMDSRENGPNLPQMMMQMSVFGDDFDSVIAGPPPGVQHAMRALIAPTARLLGYSDHYPEFAPRHDGEERLVMR